MNSFSFFLNGKLFTSPSILNDNFAESSILRCQDFFFIYTFRFLNMLCHFFQAFKISARKSVNSYMHTKLLQSCLTLYNPMDCSPSGSYLWDFPGKNTGVSCYFLLQEIFPIQGLNRCLLSLLHWQVGSLPLAPPWSPADSNRCSFLYNFSLLICWGLTVT